MKTRIITGLICGVFLISLVIFAHPYLIALIAFFASLMGLYELYKVVGISDNIPLVTVGFSGAAFAFVSNMFFKENDLFALALLFALFLVMIFYNKKTDIKKAALTFVSVFYIPFLFSFVPLVMLLEKGRLIIWFVIFGAFITDTFAYFTGVFFGRHKLCPVISPKKTIEGAIGGTLGCGILFPVLGYFFNSIFSSGFNLYVLFLYGLIAAAFAQLGDLSASAIKRSFGVKDYGSVFPGHGGIMDRCDSLIFVAPLIYFLFAIL